MSISSRAKEAGIAVLLGIVASAIWDGVKAVLGFRVSIFALHELFQLAYLSLVAGIGVYIGRRLAIKKNAEGQMGMSALFDRKVFVVSTGRFVWLSGDAISARLKFLSTTPGELVHTVFQISGLSNG
ncbi:MAG TPA: hypothetical protein VLV49_06705, partial [Terriglobales bacterium]|nr:hypothetical protein [Terriglobales bacterium]